MSDPKNIQTENSEKRFHGLDFLRAIAMLLGIVLHAPLFYYVPQISEAYSLPEIKPWIMAIVYWIHNWRMPVFFMIAGFFCLLVIESKSLGYFLKDRIIRLGIVLVIFGALFDLSDGKIDGRLMHLWFLYYLIIISFTYCFLLYLFKNLAPRLINHWHHLLFCIFQTPMRILFLLVFLILLRIFSDTLDGGTIRIPFDYLDIKIGSLFYYMIWFLIGASLFAKNSALKSISNRNSLLILGIISVISFPISFFYGQGIFGVMSSEMQSNSDVLIGSISAGFSTSSWVLLMVGVTNVLIKNTNKVIRWLVELSYPIYIIHLLPSEKICEALILNGFSQSSVFILTIFLTFIVSTILYYAFVKYTPLNWIINGYRKSWFRFSLKGKN